MKRIIAVLFVALLLASGSYAGEQQTACPAEHGAACSKQCHCKCGHQPIVKELITILKARPDLEEALLASLKKANRLDAPTLEAYFRFLDDMVTLIPTDRNLYAHIVEFYYLINQSPGDKLNKDELFQQWTVRFAEDWGSFLDTPESAAGIQTFLTDPDFHMEDYFEEPSGWRTFNQFFAREIKPGKRPVDHPTNDKVIVAPADTTFRGCWKISEDSEIFIQDKGRFSVMQLLDRSPYKERFEGGIFMHAFLNVNDYHRYHVPVRGEVLEVRDIPGNVVLNVEKWDDGSLHAVDDEGYQFTQARGLVIQDSPIGLVATIPIGMAQVSSCMLTVDQGSYLAKGEEFGFFLFGGSDIIVMFEAAAKVSICAEIDKHYNQGRAIAYAGDSCPALEPDPETRSGTLDPKICCCQCCQCCDECEKCDGCEPCPEDCGG